MKSHLVFVILIIPMVLLGCGGGDDSVTPDPPAPPLAEATVGDDGGELITTDFILTVPPGALAEDVDLRLFADNSETPFAGGMPVFRLEGLPEVLAQPVTVRLRLSGDKTGSATLFRGEERESYEGGRALGWSHVGSRDSLGWILAEVDRGAYVLDGEKAGVDMKLVLEMGLEQTPTSSGHYEIFYHPERTTAGQVALIAAHFEQAWTAVSDLGFQFGGADIWPRPVYLGDIPTIGCLAQYTVAPYGKGYFVFEPEALANSIVMGMMIGHEVLHSAQDHFDTRPPSTWKTLNIKRLWLDEATSSWFEGQFYPEDDFHPLSLTADRYLAPLSMFAGQRGRSWADMGYGLSPLIKYVVDRQSEGRILEAYERFTEVGDATIAFLETVDPAMDTWVVDFFHEWVSGNIYPFLEPGTPIPYQEPTYALVAGETDAYHATWKVWEMGASLSYLTISDEREEPAPMLKIIPEPGSPFQVSLYGMNTGQHPILLATDPDSLVVENLPDLCEDYETFMALGVRIDDFVPGAAEAEYRDPVIAFKDDDLARFETATVWFKYRGQYLSGYLDNQMVLDFEVDLGRVRNHVYHAEWDSLAGSSEVHRTGYFTIRIDPVTMDIQTFSAAYNNYNPETKQLNTLEISGTAVPLESIQLDQIKWKVEGVVACEAVSHMDYQRVVDGEVEDGLAWYECLDSSYLILLLRDNE